VVSWTPLFGVVAGLVTEFGGLPVNDN